MTETPRYSALALYRRALREARPFWPQIAGIFLLDLLSTPLALLGPLPLTIIADSVIGSQPLPGFLQALLPPAVTSSRSAVLGLAVGLTVAIALLSGLQGLASSLFSTYIGEKLVLGFRTKLFDHVQRLSLSYHDEKGTSDSTFRIQYDAPAVRWIAIDGIIPYVMSGLTLVGMIYVTARISWQLALIALAISPILVLLTRFYGGPSLREKWQEAYQLQSSSMSVVQEGLGALRVVKAFGKEKHEQERFRQRAAKGLEASIHVALAGGRFDFLRGLVTAVGMAAVLFVGARQVLAGTLTLGTLLLVASYVQGLFGPLQSVTAMVGHNQRSLASAERAFSLLDEAQDVVERPNARSLTRASGDVAFRDVCFGYDNDHPVLHDISFQASPGTRVGIAGMTGAGKTTLTSLLIRFYDPTVGQILLDGIDLRDYKLADLRDQFAVVLQEPVLFSTSIAENIAYARPGASEQEVIEAAKAANAHGFILSLPKGYETEVGERGMRLSGGERQRISLARAFLKDAPILILDEPTSSVDIETEAAIMQAMERLMEGRTTFVISHRQSAIENCDVLLVIQDGHLAEIRSSAG